MALQTLGSDTGLYGAVLATGRARIPIIRRSARLSRSTDPDVTQDDSKTSIPLLVVVILITIVIFVLVIAFYEIARERLILNRSEQISDNIAESEQDAKRIRITARASYQAAIDFAITSLIIALIVLPILFYVYSKL